MSRVLEHRHHRIPKHMGGTDDESNMVTLTVEDHAIAHFVLWKMHGKWQDKLAWQGLSKRIGSEDVLRAAVSYANKGRPKSDEWKKQHSEFMKGNQYGKHFVKGHEIRLGMKHTEETKEKQSIAAKSQPRVSCLNCKKQNLPLPRWKQHHITKETYKCRS